MEYLSVFSPNAKMQTRITPNTDTFQAVYKTCLSVSIVNFEQVNVNWKCQKLSHDSYKILKIWKGPFWWSCSSTVCWKQTPMRNFVKGQRIDDVVLFQWSCWPTFWNFSFKQVFPGKFPKSFTCYSEERILINIATYSDN